MYNKDMIKLIISEQSELLKRKLNEYIKKEIVEKDDFNYASFDFEVDKLDDIIFALEGLSFTSLKKIVVCKNPYFFSKESVKTSFDNDFRKLENYLKNPNENSDLIIICPNKYAIESNKYYKLLAKSGDVINLTLSSGYDFDNYANELIKLYKITIDADGKIELINRTRGDVCKLEIEIAKLANYSEPLDKKMIMKLVARPLEDKTYELSNAILATNIKKAYSVYLDLKLQKVEPVAICGYLASLFKTILLIAIMHDEGKSFAEIAKELNYQPYRIQKLYESVASFGIYKIKETIVKLADIDIKLKSSAEDKYVLFEMFLLSI